MQKKIVLLLIGYILVICVVGGGFLLKRQFDNIPVVDEALIQELIDSSGITKVDPGETTVPPESSEEQGTDPESTENNYWENYYQETETGVDGKNPDVSKIQDKITAGDKLRIMKIMQKNLSADDIKHILSLSKDGFNSSEKTEIKAILKEKIGNDEKQELKTLLLKYL